jgi:hypothetical protein
MASPYEKDMTNATLLERLDHAVALATKLHQQAQDLFVEQEKQDEQ